MDMIRHKQARSLFRVVLFVLLVAFKSVCAFAAETTPVNWVLAAQKFTFSQKNTQSVSSSAFATVLPQLIVEQISIDGMRVLPSQEMLDRKLNTLQTERLSLFLQLSKEYQTRDALVLTNAKPKKLEKALQAEQKKIDEIQQKIDDNLSETERVKSEYQPKIDREAAIARGEQVEEERRDGWHFPFPFFVGEAEDAPQSEIVAVYQNDPTTLFTPSDIALAEGIASHTYEKEVLNAKINGVLTGTITAYADYVMVTVDLSVYPGARCIGTVTEVGTIADQMDIAERIVRQLVPKIANSLPVNLRFEVFPEDVASRASLTLDGLVYSKIPAELQVDAAVHTIAVEANGYETASFTYKYEGNERYRIRVSLTPAQRGVLNLRLKKPRDGIFYPRGFEEQPVTGYQAANVTVNGKSVLGIFTVGAGEDAESAFFYIPEKRAQDGANLKVNAKPFNREQNIDKRRRWMYTAYTALMCSLPFTFYCTGNFTVANNAYMLGRGSYDDAVTWQNRMYIASGVSIACGVWAAFELVRYLWAANQVLPATATVDKRDFSAPAIPVDEPADADAGALTDEETVTEQPAAESVAETPSAQPVTETKEGGGN